MRDGHERVNVYMPTEIKEKVERKATLDLRSVSATITKILENYFKTGAPV